MFHLLLPSSDSSAVRLLLVTGEDHVADRRYGLGRSLVSLAAGLSRRGHHVRYLCGADRSPRSARWLGTAHRALVSMLRPCWAEADVFLRAFLGRVDTGRQAAKLAAREKYTHVHLHDPWLAYGYRMFAGIYRPAASWGVTEHGFGCYSQATLEDCLPQGPRLMRRLRRLEASVLAGAGWVIAPTRAALEQLSRDLCLPAPAERWKAIPHARPALTLTDRAQARKQLGWSPDALYVLGVGRLVPLKRFPLVIDAVAGLSGDVRLVLLGDGDRESLRRRGEKAGLAHPIEFAFPDDVGLHLSAADLYVSASATESFGLANLEALSAGVATLCTAVGGVPEVVGDAAWLVPGELDALRSALACLASDALLRARYAARGKARAAAWPDIDAIVERYESIYLGNPEST